MLTRRSAVLASAFIAAVALPAKAQPHHSTAAKSGARGAKKDQPAGSPADTPLGQVDTAARWAFIQDFATGAHAVGEECRRGDAAVVDDKADDDLSGLRAAEAGPHEAR